MEGIEQARTSKKCANAADGYNFYCWINHSITTKMEDTLKTIAQIINECGSVAEAARKLGVTAQTIHRWQSGSFKPSRVMVELMAMKGVDLLAPLVAPVRSKRAG